MADVSPFRGFFFDFDRVALDEALCPPYDAIAKDEAARLREHPFNAVHLELPGREGPARYAAASATWRRWREQRVLVMDSEPALYVLEEHFTFEGRALRRLGFIGALGVAGPSAKTVVPHERILPGPKNDRLRMLDAVGANLSPIFCLYADGSGTLRRLLDKVAASKPLAEGTSLSGIRCRLWRLADPEKIRRICRGVGKGEVFIADGHHRFEAACRYWRSRRTKGSESVLSYFCAEEDPGLVVRPTHRVVKDRRLEEKIGKLCAVSRAASLAELLERLSRSSNPYAFGLFEGAVEAGGRASLPRLERGVSGKGGYRLCVPLRADGCVSGLGSEWIARHLLKGLPAGSVRSTPDPKTAQSWARETGARVLFVKPMNIAQVRGAVRALKLLPPKSTYFFPKIATGLVFKSVRPEEAAA